MGRHRLALAATVVALSAVGAGVAPATAAPRDTTTVNIVGTSDVSDSHLIVTGPEPSALVAGFQAAYPQYTLNYTGKATGTAISLAESGAADGLIVHAESLENQFVQGGYSYEQYGRALFYGDFVLLGPKSDPAGVTTSDPENIVGALEAIAAAGDAGKADFVSRGDTSGTAVEEHQLWALTNGVPTCTISSSKGGGAQPSTTGGTCSDNSQPPSWYHETQLTQAPNIEAADTCNFPNASGGNDCYVLTDRGTYDYLASTGALHNLQVVVRNNPSDNLLSNYFHGYVVNPAKFPNASLNTAGATAFMNYLTSPAGQRIVKQYLADQPGGSPFLPDAAPRLRLSSKLPSHVVANDKSRSVTGTLANIAPGTPPLASQPVALTVTANGVTRQVATASTNAHGMFMLRFRPYETGTYAVQTNELYQVENRSLDPVFTDELSPAKASLGRVVVEGRPHITSLRRHGRELRIRGTLSPAALTRAGVVSVIAGRGESLSHAHRIATATVSAGSTRFAISTELPRAASDTFVLQWAIPGQIAAGRTVARTVHRA